MDRCEIQVYIVRAYFDFFSSSLARVLAELPVFKEISCINRCRMRRVRRSFTAVAPAAHSLKFRKIVGTSTRDLGATWAQNRALWAQIKGTPVSRRAESA
jgi:hypothetical protein